MRQRQPDVERHDARLGAEADQGEQEDRVAVQGLSEADRIEAKEVVRSPADRSRNIASRATKPACVTAMYQWAARTVPGRSCSVDTIA